MLSVLALAVAALISMAPRVASATTNLSSQTLPVTGLSPASSSAQQTYPASVSCPSTTLCVSVGQYQDNASGYDGVVGAGTYSAGTWSWTVSTMPTSGLDPAPDSLANVSPTSISCPSTTTCVAVGQYEDGASHFDGFIGVGALSSGSWSWVMTTVPTSNLSPSAATSSAVNPYSVACPSSSSCVLAGQYASTGNDTYGFFTTGTLSAGTWTWASTSLPIANLSPQPRSGYGVSPTSISCPSTTSCILIGSYPPTSTTEVGFAGAGTLSAGTWTWSLSNVSTTGLIPGQSTSTAFLPTALACPSTTSCVGVGNYFDTNAAYDGFVATGTLSSGVWTWAVSTTDTAGLDPASNATPGVSPLSVACPTTTNCVAVGTYTDASDYYDAMISEGTLSSGVWTWANSTVPTTGLSPAPASATYFSPAGVACASATTCVSTGNYRVTGGSGAADGFATVFGLSGATTTTTTTTSTTTTTTTSTTSTTTTTVPKVNQAPLYISNTKVSSALRTTVHVSTRGGSGSGAVTLRASGGCTLTGSALSATRPHACAVVATKAGDSRYKAQTSAPVTFYFGFKAQAPLVLKVSSTTASHTSLVRLSTRGGSGRGAVHFSVTGLHCSVSSATVGATASTTCTVVATKASSGTYLPASSKPARVRFT